jgi:hypothetical protein
VIRKRLGRIATVLTAALMLLTMAFAAGPVAAANPTWAVSFVNLPATVGPNNDAGWAVTVLNKGPSNINDLHISLTSSVTGELPAYLSELTLSSGGAYSCSTATGAEVCSVGTLMALGTVTFTVAFHVPTGWTGSFNVNVGLVSGTGDTDKDGPGQSRGDKKTFTWGPAVSQSTNFDGGFVIDDQSYATTGALGRGNKQTSQVDVTDSLLTVNVADGNLVTTPTCDVAKCAGAFGEWTFIDVPGNINLIKVTLNIWGGAVPGGVSTDGIYLIHVLDDGTIQIIGDDANERCTPATGTPTNPECVTVTKIGSNYRIVGWLLQNGSIRGGF